MERSEVKERVYKVICSVLNIDADMIEETSNFIFDLGVESMQSVQLVAGFEDEFDIEMDDDAMTVAAVGPAIDYIAKYLD